jgi:hypothetical protein
MKTILTLIYVLTIGEIGLWSLIGGMVIVAAGIFIGVLRILWSDMNDI